jgi:HprK-related kinase A
VSLANEPFVSTSASRSLRYRIGEIDVALRSELDDVLEDFSTLYRGCRPGFRDGHQTIRVDVATTRRSPWRRRRYRVLGDGEPFGPELHHEQVLPLVEWGINHRVVVRRAEFLQIHAATLAWRGQGVVFPGQSGSGKSTLALGLLSRGWKYLSEEFALISAATTWVHPFPKALCIKAGAFDTVQGMNIPFAGRCYNVEGYKGRVAYVNPLDFGEHAIGDQCPIRYIIFPRYAAGSVPRLRKMSPATAAFELLRHSMNRSTFRERALSILAEVVRGAECFQLESSALDDACETVEDVVSGRTRRSRDQVEARAPASRNLTERSPL